MTTEETKRAVVAEAVSKGFEMYKDESLDYNYTEALGFLEWHRQKTSRSGS